MHGKPFLLILHIYSAHPSAKLRQRASELVLQLLFVPAGVTSTFQPLDRQIFGQIKSRAKAQFAQLGKAARRLRRPAGRRD
jgi:hypothetical protein